MWAIFNWLLFAVFASLTFLTGGYAFISLLQEDWLVFSISYSLFIVLSTGSVIFGTNMVKP